MQIYELNCVSVSDRIIIELMPDFQFVVAGYFVCFKNRMTVLFLFLREAQYLG